MSMFGKFAIIGAAMVAVGATGSACAMTSPARSIVDCKVVGADKLPAATGGAQGICGAIEQAARQHPGKRFKVEVRVVGSSRLSATLTTATGKILPERRFAVSDRPLGKGSIERFAKSLVAEVARASGASNA